MSRTLQFDHAVTIPATTTPIDLVEAKSHLRVNVDVEDTYITELINAAVDMVEQAQNRQLSLATITLNTSRFPSANSSLIYLPSPPLQAVTSIQYVDTDGVTQTWNSTKYDVVTDAMVGYVIPKYGECYPTAREGTNAVTITYTAGYATPADIPSSTKHAIKLMLSNMFEAREPVVVGTIATALPLSYDVLVSRNKVPIHLFRKMYEDQP